MNALSSRVAACAALSSGALFFSGCATPVGVSRVGADASYAQITRSAISGSDCSDATRIVIHRYALDQAFEKRPVDALVELQKRTATDRRRDLLFALSELSFRAARAGVSGLLGGRRVRPHELYAVSAVYSYLFLLGPGDDPVPGPYDRRFRIACDLYNQSLDRMLLGSGHLNDSERTVPILAGAVRVKRGPSDLETPLSAFDDVVAADSLKVRGLSVRDREGGLGSPVVAVMKKKHGRPIQRSTAATLFVRVEGDARNVLDGSCTGSIEVYSPLSDDAASVNHREVPLESDRTASLAYALNDPIYWALEKNLFFVAQAPFKTGLYSLEPYSTNRIPVIFVHGTMSSPVWWAEMLNTLRSDRRLRSRFQFWFFLYDSAKPIMLSAQELRSAITNRVAKLDPDGKDPALQEMVVIGHSQGGLLTKLTVTDTGDTLIKAVTGKTLDELKLPPDRRAKIAEFAVLKPLPQVKRVVFISTPHRGSYLAGGFARSLVRRLVTLPRDVVEKTGEILHIVDSTDLPKELQANLPKTSIDSMSPKYPGLLALADIPVAKGVKAHSIVAIQGDDQPPAGQDGVVAYTSAHVPYVESEFIVRSGHSCQQNPLTIEEVRRILLEHTKEYPP